VSLPRTSWTKSAAIHTQQSVPLKPGVGKLHNPALRSCISREMSDSCDRATRAAEWRA
jgi:hypothetical protein